MTGLICPASEPRRCGKDNGTVTSPPLRCDSAQRPAPLADLGGDSAMPPRLPISSLRKGLAVVTATGLIGAAAVFGAATADAATTQTGSCVDGGGVRWTAKAIWGGTYTSGGVRKISINYAGWTTNASCRANRLDRAELLRRRHPDPEADLVRRLRLQGRHRVPGAQPAQPGERARQGQGQDHPRRRRRRTRQLLGHLHPARQRRWRWRGCDWRLRERPLRGRRGVDHQRRADLARSCGRSAPRPASTATRSSKRRGWRPSGGCITRTSARS